MKKFFWLMAVLFLSANATFAQLGTNPVLEQRVERACKCTLSQAKAKPNGMRNTLQIKVRSLVQKGLMTPAQAGLVRQFSTVQSLAQGKSIATKLKAISPGNSVAAQMANGALDFIRQHEQETEAYASKSASDAFNTICTGIATGALVGGMAGGPQGAAIGAAVGGAVGAAVAAYDEWTDGDEGDGGKCDDGGDTGDGGGTDGGDTGGGGDGGNS